MSLQSAYKQFLAAPTPSLLATDASLHFITTLVSINGASNIVKHLNGQDYQLKKKQETFLNIVEGTTSIAAEIHTTIEFKTSGGSYLPGLDDNFLADRTVTFPIVSLIFYLSWHSHTDNNGRSISLASMPMARFNKFDKIGTKVHSSS